MQVRTRVQTEVVVDGMSFVLAADESLDDLEDRVHGAIAVGGRFVRFTLASAREARVLVTPASRGTGTCSKS